MLSSYFPSNLPALILVLIIPFHLLWRIQINLRQKLILGTTLCLSIFMIIIAIVRISSIRLPDHATDIVWAIFWQQVEACTAVIMVSLSAFRSFFVTHESRLCKDRIRNRHWYMSKKKASAWRRKMLQSESEEMDHHLPQIPRATMTGMSTVIRGGESNESRMSSLVEVGDNTRMPAESEHLERIRVEQTISTVSDRV